MYKKACKILDVRIGAGQDEIKQAYRTLAKQYHPDVSDLPKTGEKFILIKSAYKYLSFPGSYSRYLNRQRFINKKREEHIKKTAVYQMVKDYHQKKEGAMPDFPPLVGWFASFLVKIYDYIFIYLGIFMILAPPLYFFFDKDFIIEEDGIGMIIYPMIIGILFLSGVLFYLNIHGHPLIDKIKNLMSGSGKSPEV